MKGRIIFDVMKVVQRDYKLPSYKLDSVAGNFIQETIIKIENDVTNKLTKIFSKGVYGVKSGQYITIMYNDGITDNKHMDGEKFQITEIKEKKKISNYTCCGVYGFKDLNLQGCKSFKNYYFFISY